jgi:adenylate cyclase
VGYVVEGSVRTAGDRVRVTAQLIDVGADRQLWSETYERRVDDVFTIQSDVAGQVTRVLKIALGAEELASIGRAPTDNLDAWQRFLKARFLLRNRTSPSDLQDAMSLVDAAIELDPRFARAHSLRALILLLRPIWETGRIEFEMQRTSGASESEIARLEEDWAEAMREAGVALQLDPKLGEPHAVRALHAQARNQYSEAWRSFRWALGRAPSDPDIRNWYGSFLLEVGYVEDALAEKLRAAELDPLSPMIAWHLAYAGIAAGRVDLMMGYSAKARENGWTGWEAWVIEGAAAFAEGRLEEAQQRMIRALPPREAEIRMAFDAYRKRRIDEPTRRMLAGLAPYGPPGIGRYATQVWAGDVDAALETILGTIDPASLRTPDGQGGPPRAAAGDWPGSVLRGDWWFVGHSIVRRDPRFAELMQQLGLVEFWREAGWPDHCRPVGDGVACD